MPPQNSAGTQKTSALMLLKHLACWLAGDTCVGCRQVLAQQADARDTEIPDLSELSLDAIQGLDLLLCCCQLGSRLLSLAPTSHQVCLALLQLA